MNPYKATYAELERTHDTLSKRRRRLSQWEAELLESVIYELERRDRQAAQRAGQLAHKLQAR